MRNIFKYINNIGLINVFFILGTLLNVLNYGYLFAYACIILIVIKKQFLKTALDRNFLLLLLFSVTYGLFYALNPWKGLQYVLLYTLTPPVFYLWGKYAATISRKTTTLFFTLIVLTILYSLPAMISVGLNIVEGGFAQPDRNLPMFWSSEIVSATQMAAFFIFNMCIPALLFISYKKMTKSALILLFVIFVISIACVLRLGSRTQLAILIISLLISLITAAPKMSVKENISIFFILGVIVFFISTKVSFDIDSDLFTSFAGRMKDGGTGDIASGGGRTILWQKSIDNLFEKPFGWDLEEFGYSHNLWLDALRVGGIIPFVILVLYFIRFLNLIRNIFFSKYLDTIFQILCLTYMLGFFSLFMVEPGIDGTFTLFILFCLFVGFVREHYLYKTIVRVID